MNGGRPCTNDPSIVKRSSGNMPGLISSRLTPRGAVPMGTAALASDKPPIQNIPGTCCTTGPVWVQGDTYNAGLNSSQSSRIDKIKRKAATCVTLKSDAGLDRCGQAPGVDEKCKSASYHIGGKKFVRTMYSKNLNPLAVDQSQYMYSGLMAKNDLPTPPCKAPFPPVGKANKWCGETYTVPEFAKAAGLISMDWGDCRKCLKAGRMKQTNMVSQDIPVNTSLSKYTENQLEGLDGQTVRARADNTSMVSYTVEVRKKTKANPYYGMGSRNAFWLALQGSAMAEAPTISTKGVEAVIFDQSPSSNKKHPLRLFVDAGKTVEHTSTVQVIGEAGSEGALVFVTVTEDTPHELYYQCANHGYMGGQIMVKE